MGQIKDELQSIIFGDGSSGQEGTLKKVQVYLRRNAAASPNAEKQQHFRGQENDTLLKYISEHDLWFKKPIIEKHFIAEGAEQKVYRLNDSEVFKINSCIFYERWIDYFDNLLIHNYFFPTTAYSLLGFIHADNRLSAIVKQDFIKASRSTDLLTVKEFLEYNHFHLKRNNDYYNNDVGIILEDLHDENVLCNDDALFFIDTIFYLTADFKPRS